MEFNTFYNQITKRRSCRDFDLEKIDLEKLKSCLLIAGCAPSGANAQPWFFSVVLNKEIKKQIRDAAENEEKIFYSKRANERFLNDLQPFGTNWQKPHLEEASALIVIFQKSKNPVSNKYPEHCYYPKESVGIATGFLLSALHMAGFHTLTHTPSPMNFLNQILKRPLTEKPFMIIAVGHAKKTYCPPAIYKKSLDEICELYI